MTIMFNYIYGQKLTPFKMSTLTFWGRMCKFVRWNFFLEYWSNHSQVAICTGLQIGYHIQLDLEDEICIWSLTRHS